MPQSATPRETVRLIIRRHYHARHDPAKAHTLRPGRVYLCIGPGCWGKGFTPQDAEAAAKQEWSGNKIAGRMPFLMFDAPPDCYIDGMGGTVYTPCLYQTQEQIDALRDPKQPARDRCMADDPEPAQTIGDRPIEIYRWGTK